MIVAWRAAQQPDDLLDRDLRHALGKQYWQVGSEWARWLREGPPRATLLRR